MKAFTANIQIDLSYVEFILDNQVTLHMKGCFNGNWAESSWLNTPGPFFGAHTDTCGAGPPEAPSNVLTDIEGEEFIYRQPRNYDEFQQVINAACVEPFEGYNFTGSEYWTLATIRQWWKDKDEVLDYLELYRTYNLDSFIDFYKINRDAPNFESRFQKARGHILFGLNEWENHIQTDMVDYLSIFAFFVEERRLPKSGDKLPEI